MTAVIKRPDPGVAPAPTVPAPSSPLDPVAVPTAKSDPAVPVWQGAVPRDRFTPAHPMLWLLGVSGGVGVSSLTRSLAFAGDARRRWPGLIGFAPGQDSPLVVLVCRTTMGSLVAAHELLLQHSRGETPAGTQVLALVSVADSDRRVSAPVRDRLAVIEPLVPQVFSVPWLEPWRSLAPEQLPVWGPGSTLSHDRHTARDPVRTPLEPIRGLYGELLGAARTRLAQMTTGLEQQ